MTKLSPARYNRPMERDLRWVLVLAMVVLLMAACTGSGLKASPTPMDATPAALAPTRVASQTVPVLTSIPDSVESESADTVYNMFAVYPTIPAILDPRFVAGEAAREQYDEKELVLGVSINGDHRAYSIPHLGFHEVVNDEVGGIPVAITW